MLRVSALRRPATLIWRTRSIKTFATVKSADSKARELPESSFTPLNTSQSPTLPVAATSTSTSPVSGIPLKPLIEPIPTSNVSKPLKKPRRFRRFLLFLTLLTGVSFGAGVWYSLVSDNFHDFFTEYIPFGEDAVLYLEELQFRKRFPNATKPTDRSVSDHTNRVTIPSKSGLSWRVSEVSASSDLETKGRHMSAVESQDQGLPKPAPAPPKAVSEAPNVTLSLQSAPGSQKVEARSVEAQSSAPASRTVPSTPASALTSKPRPSESTNTKIEVSETTEATNTTPISKKRPSADSLTSINPLEIQHANEPLVQDLVKTLNDIIAVVNADNSGGRFSSTIEKAKSELAEVGRKIINLKSSEHAAAEKKIKDLESEFDNGARELVRRLEDEMHEQESRWRAEFEVERERISQGYQSKLQSELEKTKELLEQQAKNTLLEQAVTLKQDFYAGIKSQVESERNGRLARLSELASSVSELEDLTVKWDSVIDANLKTQRLQVAIEAVRASLENSDRPRPFMNELATLKEIAGDPVVDSAIASINPMAYQQGIPTAAQLVDRFRRVAAEVRKASLLPNDAGVASHAASLLLSKVQFKGTTGGDDVESVLTRTEHLLEQGSLDEAAREMNAMTGWAKSLSADWLAEVRRVLEVRQAFDVIATEARLQSLKVE